MPSITSPQSVYWPVSRRQPCAEADEELAVGAVRVAVRAAPTLPRLNSSCVNSAGRSGSFEPPDAGAGRIAGLRHEAGDHAVEYDAVVEALLRQQS